MGFPYSPNSFVVFHGFPRSPIIHLHQLFMLFIAVVALLVLVVAIAVVDLRHGGF